jgi:hypothetical protein
MGGVKTESRLITTEKGLPLHGVGGFEKNEPILTTIAPNLTPEAAA